MTRSGARQERAGAQGSLLLEVTCKHTLRASCGQSISLHVQTSQKEGTLCIHKQGTMRRQRICPTEGLSSKNVERKRSSSIGMSDLQLLAKSNEEKLQLRMVTLIGERSIPCNTERTPDNAVYAMDPLKPHECNLQERSSSALPFQHWPIHHRRLY